MIEVSEKSVLKILTENRELSEQVTRLQASNTELLERARKAEDAAKAARRLADRIEARDLDPGLWADVGELEKRCLECDCSQHQYSERWYRYEDMALCSDCFTKIVRPAKVRKEVDLGAFVAKHVFLRHGSENEIVFADLLAETGFDNGATGKTLDRHRSLARRLLEKFVAEQEGP